MKTSKNLEMVALVARGLRDMATADIATDWVNGWSTGCQVIRGGSEGAALKSFERLVYQVAAEEKKRISHTLASSAVL